MFYSFFVFLTGIPDIPVEIVIEHDLQLVRGPGVVQEVRGELLDLAAELGELGAELGLHLLQFLQLVGELESGQDRIGTAVSRKRKYKYNLPS